MPENIKTTGIPQKELRKIIDKAKAKIKDHDVIKDIFEDHNVDLKEFEFIPVCFADIDVSARTDHGCIYLNIKLLDDPECIPHYLTHEIVHWGQQTTGNKPTKGANDGDYLENEYEIEGFQKQVEYIADTEGEEEAEEYVEQVLDHHDYEGEKAEDKKDELMKAVSNNRFFSFLKEGKSKTLYHGTLLKNVYNILESGLKPGIGAFVDSVYGSHKPVKDWAPNLVYAADKDGIQKVLSAIQFAIHKEYGKSPKELTDEDIEKFGAVIVLKDMGDKFNYSYKDNPPIEEGDYYTDENISVQNVLTGAPMMRFFRQYDVYPKHGRGDKAKKELAIKYLKQQGNDNAVDIVNNLNEKDLYDLINSHEELISTAYRTQIFLKLLGV